MSGDNTIAPSKPAKDYERNTPCLLLTRRYWSTRSAKLLSAGFMGAERLQKIIAAAGIASRRKAEELISSGRVAVNGRTVTELGTKADPEQDHIRVDGKLLHGPERQVYLLLNKPKGYVTTVSDPEGRPTIMSLLRGIKARVYPVGRLDFASEGLLLLTNDGTLAQLLMKAASHVPKTYLIKVSGQPSEEAVARLRSGVSIETDEGRRVKTAPAKIRIIREAANPWYEITLIEGRNRQIRRMFQQVGHHVEKIKRVRYGPLQLDVPPGEYRRLTAQEVTRLKNSIRSAKLSA
jgi:23S rRNA pseudouridine2605 synthase